MEENKVAQISKHTDSSRSTDSGVSGNAQTGAKESRSGFDPDDHFTLRDHPRNAAAVERANRHENKGHYISDLMADLDEGDICDGLCCYDCDWMTLFPFLGKWEKQIRAFRKNPNGDRELATTVRGRKSPTKPNEPACPECSRLASRVEELEKGLKIASCQLAQGANMDFSDANIERWQEEARRIECELLAEARKLSGGLNE